MEIGEISKKFMGWIRPKPTTLSKEGQERLQSIKDKLDSQYTEKPSSPETTASQTQTSTGSADQSPPNPVGPVDHIPTDLKGRIHLPDELQPIPQAPQTDPQEK